MEKKNRIAWLDVAKGLGIWMVYLGHFGQEAGMSYDFVFQFHVPLFFFLAGCAHSLRKRPPMEVIRKISGKLLVSYAFFGLLYLAVLVIVQDSTEGILAQLQVFLAGAPRNQFAAGSLWFLTCLWVIEMADVLIGQLKPWLRLIPALTLYVLATKALPSNPLFNPCWWMNLDSAMAYFLYYALGKFLFPKIDLLSHTATPKDHLILHGTGILCLMYAVYVFLTRARQHVQWYLTVPGYDLIGTILHTLALIFAAIYVSMWLQGLRFLCRTGQETLYLCGSEDLFRLTVPMALRTFGLGITIVNPLSALIYSAGLIALVWKTAVPLEKKILGRLIS